MGINIVNLHRQHTGVAQRHRQAVAHRVVAGVKLKRSAKIGHGIVLLQEKRPRHAPLAEVGGQLGPLGQA